MKKEEIQTKAFAFIDDHRDEMLEFWKNLVNMESWTLQKEDVDIVADHLVEKINAFGGKAGLITFPKAGNAVEASFGEPGAKKPVCFLGHFDTVFQPGTVAQRPFTITDGKATGPGVLDMKGGVTIQIFVARALREAGYTDRQIKIILAGDEEEGHPFSNMDDIFEEKCRGAVAAFNFETGDVNGALVVGRKGTAPYNMMVKGVSVHAGREPQNGRSAILEMAHKIIDIQALSDYDAGTTFNVGMIKGGIARNAVPDYAEIEIDVRVLRNEQLALIDGKLKEVAAKTYIEGTTTTLERGTGSIGPMERTGGNDKLFAYVKETAATIGQEISNPVVSGGGSDSASSVKAGVPSIDQMGVKGQWNHSDREYAVVETLYERAKLAIACVLDIDKFEAQL